MPGMAWLEPLATAQAAGPTRTSFTTAITMLPDHARATIPPGDNGWWLGRPLLVKGAGQIGNVVTAQPTFTFDFRLGSSVQWSSGAILTSTTAHTTLPFWFEVMLTCRTIGATANCMVQGWVASRAFIDLGATADITTSGHPFLLAGEVTPAVGSNFDSTTSLVADMFVACGTSNASNTVTLQQYWLFG